MARPRLDRPRGFTQFACVTLLTLLVFLAVFGKLIWGGEAKTLDPAHPLASASADHWFGTDDLGRDIFARVMTASRLSLELALMAAAIGVVVGVGIGIGHCF